MTPDQTLLTTGEVATRYRVGQTTVRRWADSGQLASFKTPGGRRRFRAADVEALIAETSTGSAGAA
jgi:excisionase family DNA binding protein